MALCQSPKYVKYANGWENNEKFTVSEQKL